MWIIVSPILPIRNPNHSLLFPLVGWLIEGFEETPLTTGFYDDRWCTKPAFYFYRKDIMDQTWLLFSIVYGIILPIQLTNMVGTTNIDFHIFQRDWNHQPVSNCSIFLFMATSPLVHVAENWIPWPHCWLSEIPLLMVISHYPIINNRGW